MGFELDFDLITRLRKRSKAFADQLDNGMPLAKAALLIKEGNIGLSIGLVQQGSSLSPVGGNDLALADAISKIMPEDGSQGVLAVAQYTNTGGDTGAGGHLVVTRGGQQYITTAEGQRGLFLESYFLKNDYLWN